MESRSGLACGGGWGGNVMGWVGLRCHGSALPTRGGSRRAHPTCEPPRCSVPKAGYAKWYRKPAHQHAGPRHVQVVAGAQRHERARLRALEKPGHVDDVAVRPLPLARLHKPLHLGVVLGCAGEGAEGCVRTQEGARARRAPPPRHSHSPTHRRASRARLTRQHVGHAVAVHGPGLAPQAVHLHHQVVQAATAQEPTGVAVGWLSQTAPVGTVHDCRLRWGCLGPLRLFSSACLQSTPTHTSPAHP